jgi:hypothetical protein
MNPIRNFLIGAACLLSIAASAQWQWTDKDGRKVFSDRAPPPDILEKNILKRPGGRGTPAGTSETASGVGASNPAFASALAAQGSASAPKLSGVDKELADKKKKAEEAEQAKRKAEEDRIVKVKVENCARAKQAKTSFDSGARVARTNEKGEREMMDDAARSAEIKRIQAIMDADCK